MTRANGVTVTVTQRTATGTDAYGDPTFSTTTFDIPGCLAAPREGSELDAQGRNGVVILRTLYVPECHAGLIGYHDTITLEGEEFDVEGKPNTWRSTSGVTRGDEVNLRRVVG